MAEVYKKAPDGEVQVRFAHWAPMPFRLKSWSDTQLRKECPLHGQNTELSVEDQNTSVFSGRVRLFPGFWCEWFP
jgi:hypothetical protein